MKVVSRDVYFYEKGQVEALEKIKTEIESKQEESNIKDEEGCVDEGITYAYNVGIADCLEIIDKHIAELKGDKQMTDTNKQVEAVEECEVIK